MNYELGIRNYELGIRRLLIVFVFLIPYSLFLIPSSAEAAALSFSAPADSFYVNQLIPVKILLDTENETLNAFEIYVNYPEEFVNLESVNDANSIINFWVKRDVGINNGFTGVSIGGYKGPNGLVLQLNFRAKKIGKPSISFKSNSQARLHDGLGTEAALNLNRDISLNIVVKKVKALEPVIAPKAQKIVDKEPPECSPILAQSPNVFDGRYFLIFTAQDKGSGIDHYEVQETTADKPSSSGWVVSGSPYLLKDQELGKHVFVKAIDNEGNEKILGLKPQFQPYPQWFWWLIVILVILILLLIVFVIIKIIGRKNKIQQINGNTKLD